MAVIEVIILNTHFTINSNRCTLFWIQ